MVIPRGTPIGHLETIFADGAYKVDEAAVEASLAQAGSQLPPPPPPPPSAERAQQILREATLTVPDIEKQKYTRLLLANHDIFSVNKHDLGRANNFTHKISLKKSTSVCPPVLSLLSFKTPTLTQQTYSYSPQSTQLMMCYTNFQTQSPLHLSKKPFTSYPKRTLLQSVKTMATPTDINSSPLPISPLAFNATTFTSVKVTRCFALTLKVPVSEQFISNPKEG
jgi:hypothetical protein